MNSVTKKPVVIIGGSGFSDRLQGERTTIATKFGNVTALVSKIGDRDVYAIKRHGDGHAIPPHKVNYRANISVATEVGADAIFATSAVGVIRTNAGMDGTYVPGDIILCSDVLPWGITIDGGPVTFFNDFKDGLKHTDCSNLFSEKLNALLVTASTFVRIMEIKANAVIATTPGLRYETPAEISMFRMLGVHLVGMTIAYEAILAAELDILFAAVAIGTNWAAEKNGTKLSHDEVKQMMARRSADTYHLIKTAIELKK